jgi:hypothetical protein
VIPSLSTVSQEIDLNCNSPLSTNSLPEVTGSEDFLSRNASFGADLSKCDHLLLNPLGAGDTCSAIFLLEYLATRVMHFS